jgi:hypothetical protein
MATSGFETKRRHVVEDTPLSWELQGLNPTVLGHWPPNLMADIK